MRGCRRALEQVEIERTLSKQNFTRKPSEEDQRAPCERFVRAVPALESAWRKHLSDSEGEPLQHVFFGSVVAPYFINWVDEASPEERRRFLDAIEELAAAGAYSHNLVTVSFVENMAWGNERELALLDRYWAEFGPATQRAVVAMRAYPASLRWDVAEVERRTQAERDLRSRG